MRILIVEDDMLFAGGLKAMLQENMGYEVSGIAQDYNEALRLIKATKPDLLLLDILIKSELNGIHIAEQVQQMKLGIPIIFVTSMHNKDTFEQAKSTSPYAYLTKPVDIESMQRAIELALHKYTNRHAVISTWSKDVAIQDSFFVKVGRQIQKVHIPAIYYLEVERNYSNIILKQAQFQVRMSLKELTRKLPANQFFRVNKSFMVNLHKVENVDLERSEVQLGEYRVPLSKRYRKDLLRVLGMA